MRKPLFGITLAALMGFAYPAAAQHLTVQLRLGDGPVVVRGYYASRPQYVIPRRFACEPDGAFLYCWDRAAYRAERPLIYVYPADRRFVPVPRDYRHEGDATYWRHAANRVFERWSHRHGYDRGRGRWDRGDDRYGRSHGRDRDDDAHVAVVLAWRR